MRVRPGLLLVLPLLIAVPAVSALTLLSASEAPAAAASPSSTALVAAAIGAEPRLVRGALEAASPAAAATPSTAAAPASRTRIIGRALTAARPAVASAPTAAAKPASQPTSKPAAQPAPKPAATTAPAPAPTKTAASVPTGRDDYPYRTATTNSYDDWGFTKRQCVSFAAWRLAQSGNALDNRAEGWGSALTWDDVARQRGKAVTTSPAVGAVAHWNAGEVSAYYGPGSTTANGRFAAGSYGHVGWVTHVFADGSAQVEQYNSGGDRSWSTMRVKAPRYLRLTG